MIEEETEEVPKKPRGPQPKRPKRPTFDPFPDKCQARREIEELTRAFIAKGRSVNACPSVVEPEPPIDRDALREKVDAILHPPPPPPPPKKKQVAWNKGLKCGSHSEERKRKIARAAIGRRHSEETRRKISESNKGVFRSDEQRQGMSEAMKRSWARRKEKSGSVHP